MNKTAFSLILMAGLLLAALPAKLGGRGVSLLVSSPYYLELNNPFFRFIQEDEAQLQQFDASAHAKLVKFWKTPTKAAEVMGWDLIVLRPEANNLLER